MALNDKQRRFVDEYLVDLNATQAAIRAGYSAKTAAQIGERLLRKVEIQGLLADRQKARSERTEITQDMVLNELAKIAFSDQRKVMTWGLYGVRLRDSSELTDDEAAIVAEVSETTSKDGGSLKLKTHDKVGALKLIGDHLGMWKQKMELTGVDGGPVQISDTERAAKIAAILAAAKARRDMDPDDVADIL